MPNRTLNFCFSFYISLEEIGNSVFEIIKISYSYHVTKLQTKKENIRTGLGRNKKYVRNDNLLLSVLT